MKRARGDVPTRWREAHEKLADVERTYSWWGSSVVRVAETYAREPHGHTEVSAQESLLRRTYPHMWTDGSFRVSRAPVRDRNTFFPALPFDSKVAIDPIPRVDMYSYFHGNWVGFHDTKTQPWKLDKRYVATQAPLGIDAARDTRGDFWLVAFQHRWKSIVMLTPFREGPVQKAEQYFPEQTMQSRTYRVHSAEEIQAAIEFKRNPTKWLFEITVTCEKSEEIQIADQWVERRELTVLVRKSDGSELGRHSLVHFHYLSWPDGGIPTSAEAILDLASNFPEMRGIEGAPVAVHCSAGHGRTGTFLSLLLAIYGGQMGSDALTSYFLKCFLAVRRSRFYTVSTLYQLLFALRVYALHLDRTAPPSIDVRQISVSMDVPHRCVLRCMNCYVCEANVKCVHPHADEGPLPFCSKACSDKFCSASSSD